MRRYRSSLFGMLNLFMKFKQTRARAHAFNRREEEGFVYMFHSSYYGLYFFAMRLLNDKKRADLIVQKTFISIWINPGKWKSVAAIKVELYRTLKKYCILHLKRIGKYNAEILKRSFMHELIRSLLFHDIKCTLDYLPVELHELFRLRFVLQEELDDVGNRLKMSRTKVRQGEAKIIQLIKENYRK